MLINLFVAARNAFAAWRGRQRAYDELMALDDRSLADIGIRRSEIPAVVEGFHERTRARQRPTAARRRLIRAMPCSASAIAGCRGSKSSDLNAQSESTSRR